MKKFILFLLVAFTCIACEPKSILNNKPSAIDVYKGKTTIEITYKDSVAIDNVVVYK